MSQIEELGPYNQIEEIGPYSAQADTAIEELGPYAPGPTHDKQYNTVLSSSDEGKFKQWVQKQSRSIGRDLSRDTEDYDLRGYWLQNKEAPSGHFPDTFKKPNHPTFSDESVYHDGKTNIGGHWGEGTFTPGKTNLRQYGEKGLRDYFTKHEPDVRLTLEPERAMERAVNRVNYAEQAGRAVRRIAQTINPFSTDEEIAKEREYDKLAVEFAKRTGDTSRIKGLESNVLDDPVFMAMGGAGFAAKRGAQAGYGLLKIIGKAATAGVDEALFNVPSMGTQMGRVAADGLAKAAPIKSLLDDLKHLDSMRPIKQVTPEVRTVLREEAKVIEREKNDAEKIFDAYNERKAREASEKEFNEAFLDDGFRAEVEIPKFSTVNRKLFEAQKPEQKIFRMARERGYKVDRPGYDMARDVQDLASKNPDLIDIIDGDGVAEILRRNDSTIDLLERKTSTLDDFRNTFIRGIDTSVVKSSKAGDKMVEHIRETFKQGELAGSNRIADYENAVHGFSKQEKDNLFSVLDGKAQPINERVALAKIRIRTMLDEIAEGAKGSGLTVRSPKIEKWNLAREEQGWALRDTNGELIDMYKTKGEAQSAWKAYKDRPFKEREDYIPHVVDRDLLRKRQNEVIAHLVNSGQVPLKDAKGKLLSADARVELAKQQLNIFMKRNSERRYGHLQMSRELDLPEWAYSRNLDVVLPQYFERAELRLTEAKRYGARDETLKKMIDDVAKEGGNAAQAQRMIDKMFRRSSYDPEMEKVTAKILDYQVVTKMALSQVGQIGQFVNALARTNARSIMKNIAWNFTDPMAARDFYIRSGSAINQIRMRAIHEATGGGKVAEKFLRYSGFAKMDGWSRMLASGSGKFYAEHLADKLAKNADSKFARERLKQLDIDPEEVIKNGFKLTNDQRLRAGLKAEMDTNFRNRIIENPEFASSNFGRLFYQFQSFAFQQSKFIRDYVYGELKHGNPLPTIYFLAGGQVAGQAINTIRSLVKGEEVDVDVLDNLMAAGTLGMFQVLSSMAQYGSPPLGATVRSAENYAKFIGNVMTGDAYKAVRALAKELPLLNAWLFPKEK
jgi:hypothetical protein